MNTRTKTRFNAVLTDVVFSLSFFLSLSFQSISRQKMHSRPDELKFPNCYAIVTQLQICGNMSQNDVIVHPLIDKKLNANLHFNYRPIHNFLVQSDLIQKLSKMSNLPSYAPSLTVSRSENAMCAREIINTCFVNKVYTDADFCA